MGTVSLYGIHIVSLVIEGQERLCLAQISNTLLKQFSYNEIHNRRVALGITCVQCTPVQLEILRRAGAMPVSSRRCGMITRREAERLCKSFLGDNAPPRWVRNDLCKRIDKDTFLVRSHQWFSPLAKKMTVHKNPEHAISGCPRTSRSPSITSAPGAAAALFCPLVTTARAPSASSAHTAACSSRRTSSSSTRTASTRRISTCSRMRPTSTRGAGT